LDSTHLELSQPISIPPGDYIVISIPDEADEEEDESWQAAAKRHFLEAYDGQDAMYDQL
jgi:hypothetical protein